MSEWQKRFREGFTGKKESKEKTKRLRQKDEDDYAEYLAAKKERDEYLKSKKSGYQEGGVVVVKQEKKKLGKEKSKKLIESFKNIKKILGK